MSDERTGTEQQPGMLDGMLDGIRVLDFTMYLAGPYCTRLMADLGAEVLKVEPLKGDAVRHAPPFRDGRSSYFGHFNCGKKSLCVDLKSEHGLEVVRRLAKTADVLVENYRPGVMTRLGLGYEAVRELKPDIIYCSVSGYGQTGPNAARPAFAPVMHAASGYDLSVLQHARGLDKPVANRNTIADILAAIHAHAAINAALYHRGRTGQGQHMDVALMDTMHMMLGFDYQAAQVEGGLRNPQIYQPIRTVDGFLMVAPISPANFRDLMRAIGKPELLQDPRFATGRERMKHWDQLLEEVERWSIQRSGEEAETAILSAGCPCSVYRTVAESMNDPHVAHRGSAVRIGNGAESYLVPNTPFQFRETRSQARAWVAELGEHTREILRDAGYERAELEMLIDTGVCGAAPSR